MNRPIKDATVKRCHDQPRAYLQFYVAACCHARRLTTLRGLTPCEFISRTWAKEPDLFRLDPAHHIPGL
jgi:hypothetical protein